jgi:hypothetical protein
MTELVITVVKNWSLTFTLDEIPDESPPTITSDPDPFTDSVGVIDTMTVTATGTSPLEYQWQSLTGTTVANLTGETSDSLIFTLARADSGTSRRCIVSNAYGDDTSAWALVRVLYLVPTIDSIRQLHADSLRDSTYLQAAWNGDTMVISCAGAGDSGTLSAVYQSPVDSTKMQLVSWSDTEIRAIPAVGSVRGFFRVFIRTEKGIFGIPKRYALLIKTPYGGI